MKDFDGLLHLASKILTLNWAYVY